MITLLIVDDEFGIVETLSELLEDEGYRVVAASNGAVALERLAGQRPDLILSDVMMPVLDGVALVRRLQELPECKGIPVVLMSAGQQPAAIRRGELAVSAFVRKPFEFEQVLALIRRLVG